MARLPGFAGPTNVNRSINADDEETINLYPEIVDAGTGKSQLIFHKRPGLQLFAGLGAGPVRALFAQNGRAFAVGGSYLYELFAGGTVIRRGNVVVDGNPATISSNGTGGFQLFITSGGHGYIFSLADSQFSEILDDGFPRPALMGGFVDGYFLALQGQSNKFNLSALEDGLAWDNLDFNEISQASDPLFSMLINHREVWLFGEKTTSVWVDTGDAENPFQPLGGVQIQHGIAAPWSAVPMDNTIIWLSRDEHGIGNIVRAQGYTPQRISTHAVETYINRLPRWDDGIAWAYGEEGHLFYHLYLPQADTTLVYDVSNNLWHKRAIWDTDWIRWFPHLGRCHCFAFGKHLVGDRQSAGVYWQRLDFYRDQKGQGIGTTAVTTGPTTGPGMARLILAGPAPTVIVP